MLVGLALLAILGAIVAAFFGIRSGELGCNIAGWLCALAFAFLAVQVAIGFPVESDLKSATQQEWGNRGNGKTGGLEATFARNFQIRYFPAFYVGLALLGLPTWLLCSSILDRLKKSSG